MLTLLIALSAQAGPVDGGAQIAVFPNALDKAAQIMEGFTYDVKPLDYATKWDCYDLVGVLNFNMDIELDSLALELQTGSIEVDIRFESISGEDIIIYGEDSDWLDTCPSFDLDLEYYTLTNARLEMTLAPTLNNGHFELDVIGSPSLSGDLDTDIDWVPDDLILALFEETLFTMMEEQIVALIPEYADGFLDDFVYSESIANFLFDVSLEEIDVDSDYFGIGVNTTATYQGDGCETKSGAKPGGLNPKINFGNGGGSSMAFGVTEAQLNEILFASWRDGLLCFDDTDILLASILLEVELPAEINAFDITATFHKPPQSTIDEDGIMLSFNELELTLDGQVNGEMVRLLDITTDIIAKAELSVDNDLAAFTLSLVHAELVNTTITSDPILSDRNGADERMADMAESWLTSVVSQQLSTIPVYNTLFHFWEVYIRVDTVIDYAGAFAVYASMYAEDDPEVDLVRPDTTATLVKTTSDGAIVDYWGTDDHNGTLVYATQVNSDGWSDWSIDTTTTVDGLEPGDHTMAIKSRDSWYNEDDSPAMVAFRVLTADENDLDALDSLCGCASNHGPRGLGLLLGLPLTAVMIRRRLSAQ